MERQVPAHWVERAGGTMPRLRPRGWRWQGTGGMGCPGALQAASEQTRTVPGWVGDRLCSTQLFSDPD